MDKQTLRDLYLKKRQELSPVDIKVNSGKAFEHLSNSGLFDHVNNISCYIPINNEVETKTLIDFLINRGINVYIPKHLNGFWTFSKFKSWNELEKGYKDILEPIEQTEVNVDFDLSIFPGVAFDRNGVRLGYGLGVFDRLLSNSTAVKVGLCFDFQIIQALPWEKHDLVMDYIVSEAEIVKIKK